jgi:Domain of unknown function (DUF4389)
MDPQVRGTSLTGGTGSMSHQGEEQVPGYPIEFGVVPQMSDRNRLTTAFRLILGIPQIIIVGGFSNYGGPSALTGAAAAMAFISWFAAVFNARQPRGLWDFIAFYMRWWVRVTAYLALLRDDYPPFGDEPYPTEFSVTYPEQDRNRVSVGLRLLYVIPHIVVLIFVDIAWLVVTVIAWFAILFTGTYPRGLYGFAVGAMRWNTRVQSYVFLLRDEYPPFRLEP